MEKFARILKERTHALYGLFGPRGRPLLHDFFEDRKDVALPEFLGISPRAAYIAVSEDLMKPLHGADIFGRLLLDDMRSAAGVDLFVITDSGFAPEAAPIVAWYGANNCRVLRLSASGCTFRGDSRGYISLPGVLDYEIENPKTLPGLTAALSPLFPYGWVEHPAHETIR